MKGFTQTRYTAGVLLGTIAAVAAYSHRHENVVRRHCEHIACDVRNRAWLYDLDAEIARLKELPRRERRVA